MGTITLPYTFIAGQTPTQTQWNSNPTTIATLVNGQIDKANVDSSGSDGIVTMDETQTVSGAKTWSGAAQFSAAVTVGVDDTGYDVKFFGATASAFFEWDQSADELELRGGLVLPGKLLLSTAETSVVNTNRLGQIDFQAPLDSAGTDAILVGASIWAEATATFSSTVNTTDLVFAAAIGETATAVMRMKKGSPGSLSPNTTNGMSLGTTALNWSDLYLDTGAIVDFDSGNVVITHSSGVINVSTGALQVGGVAVTTGVGVSLSGSTNNNIVTVTGANAMLGESNLNFDGSTLAITGGATITTNITGANAAGPAFVNEAATVTNPTLIPNKAELDTGIGWAVDTLTLVTGATEKMRIHSTGAVTKPLNPYVSVLNSANDTDVTGDGTLFTIDFDTEIADIGDNFASDTFTAPVTGKYSVKYSITTNQLTTSHEVDIYLVTTLRSYRQYVNAAGAAYWQVFSGAVDVDMDADDTLTITITAGSSSKVVDIVGASASTMTTYMTIQLIQ
jgi:hypothetical protein